MAGSMQAVLRSDALPAGTAVAPALVRVEVGGRDVLLCRTDEGHVVAFCATCPHQQTSLEEASFFDGKLRCVRHLYLYDPVTGENIIPTRDARPESLWKLKPGYLPVYQVDERDGWIWVSDQPKSPPASFDPSLELRPGTPGAAPVAAPTVAAAGAGAGAAPDPGTGSG
ncbi:MAG: Rieske (2Fe-2S) protein, partial [Acidimicrobiales bacterium]